MTDSIRQLTKGAIVFKSLSLPQSPFGDSPLVRGSQSMKTVLLDFFFVIYNNV